MGFFKNETQSQNVPNQIIMFIGIIEKHYWIFGKPSFTPFFREDQWVFCFLPSSRMKPDDFSFFKVGCDPMLSLGANHSKLGEGAAPRKAVGQKPPTIVLARVS